MDPIVRIWTGVEVRALREAKRMSIRTFAAHLGVSERVISKWEAGGEGLKPRPVNQSALDACLSASGFEVHSRFAAFLGLTPTRTTNKPSLSMPEADTLLASEPKHQIRHPIDGKLMALVDAGEYLHGPSSDVMKIPGFYMDVFPTTNAEYAKFIRATGYSPPQHWTRQSGPQEEVMDHPVVFVTWHDATAYTQWTAKQLPNAHQWEKAARGTQGDIYPWGNQQTPAKCNVRESGIRATTPVSRYHSGVSPYGIYDLCGNVWEWLSTSAEPGRYELKGSAFTSPFLRATPSTFNDADGIMLDDDTGFRCVAAVETIQALLKVTA